VPHPKLDPDNAALHSNLGNALRVASRTREAVRHHLQAVSLKPDYAEGFFNLGLCLRDLGRSDEALACLSRALTLSPQNKRARVEIAITRLAQGDLARGFDEYELRKQLDDRRAGAGVPPAGLDRRRSQGQAHPALSRAGPGRRTDVRALRAR